ncbi:MAG: (d)CMP kinase [Aquiluna sp.]
MAKFVVAVDGPAGSGKSSVSKAAAERLGLAYLDTGAGYRAFALHAMRAGADPIEAAISSFDYEISLDPEGQFVRLSGSDVTDAIRSAEVAAKVSEFARMPQVRQLQLDDARTRIATAKAEGIVVEGRDITTVVAPDAQVRVLLTASEAVRLARRAKEMTEDTGNLVSRDASDSKVVDFFNPAEGVTLLDTTELDFEQSVDALVGLIREGGYVGR